MIVKMIVIAGGRRYCSGGGLMIVGPEGRFTISGVTKNESTNAHVGHGCSREHRSIAPWQQDNETVSSCSLHDLVFLLLCQSSRSTFAPAGRCDIGTARRSVRT